MTIDIQRYIPNVTFNSTIVIENEKCDVSSGVGIVTFEAVISHLAGASIESSEALVGADSADEVDRDESNQTYTRIYYRKEVNCGETYSITATANMIIAANPGTGVVHCEPCEEGP